MNSTAPVSRQRRVVAGLILHGVAALRFALSVVLLLTCLVGCGLLVMGLLSWMHPDNVAAAWARTLAGIGIIGGSGGVWTLGRLGVERLAGPLAKSGPEPAQRTTETEERAEAEERMMGMRHRRTFLAIVGLLVALICLPFAAAIHVSARAPWFGG